MRGSSTSYSSFSNECTLLVRTHLLIFIVLVLLLLTKVSFSFSPLPSSSSSSFLPEREEAVGGSTQLTERIVAVLPNAEKGGLGGEVLDGRSRLRFPARWSGVGETTSGKTVDGTAWSYKEVGGEPVDHPAIQWGAVPPGVQNVGFEREFQLGAVRIKERVDAGWMKAAGMGIPTLTFTHTVYEGDKVLLELTERRIEKVGRADLPKARPATCGKQNTRVVKGTVEAAAEALRSLAKTEHLAYNEDFLRTLPIQLSVVVLVEESAEPKSA